MTTTCTICHDDEAVFDGACGACLDAVDRHIAEIEYQKPRGTGCEEVWG